MSIIATLKPMELHSSTRADIGVIDLRAILLILPDCCWTAVPTFTSQMSTGERRFTLCVVSPLGTMRIL